MKQKLKIKDILLKNEKKEGKNSRIPFKSFFNLNECI